MNTDTGVIRELAEDEKPNPEEVLFAKNQQVCIGRACFKIVDVDSSENQILLEGIPRWMMTKNRHQRRKEASELRRKMRAGSKDTDNVDDKPDPIPDRRERRRMWAEIRRKAKKARVADAQEAE